MAGKKIVLLASLVIAGFPFAAAQAQDLLPRDRGTAEYHTAPRYRDSESHPLRIVGYVLSPVGWLLREGIFRPVSYVASSTEFTRDFFGYREPFDFREPLCFSADDTVPDCRKIPPMASLNPAPEASENVAPAEDSQVVFPDVNFDFDKSTLNELGKVKVRQISQMLGEVPAVKVVVEGHTDFKGSDDYNMRLGMRRAEAVIKELTELGVDPARMSPLSFGESKPLFAEQDDASRAANRRVSFTVNTGEAVAASAPVEAPATN